MLLKCTYERQPRHRLQIAVAHPELVREFLTGYIPGEWIADTDFSTLERINASYVSETLKQRHDDIAVGALQRFAGVERDKER